MTLNVFECIARPPTNDKGEIWTPCLDQLGTTVLEDVNSSLKKKKTYCKVYLQGCLTFLLMNFFITFFPHNLSIFDPIFMTVFM